MSPLGYILYLDLSSFAENIGILTVFVADVVTILRWGRTCLQSGVLNAGIRKQQEQLCSQQRRVCTL